jgi:tetratricopeptide (TPR) repeat protein
MNSEIILDLPNSSNDVTPDKSNKDNCDSPEVIKKILKNLPEGLGLSIMDNTEFITDEDDKIKDLLELNQSNIKEYNKLMKHKYKNQLNITGLTNISEISVSQHMTQDKDQTVLFGNNFANTSKTGSETSTLKIDKKDIDGYEEKKVYNMKPDFSMSKQIEEFKIQFEKGKSSIVLAEIPEDPKIKEIKTPVHEDSRMSMISDIDDPQILFAEESVRNTQTNMEWENIVRDATNRKTTKNVAEDINHRESQFYDFVQAKKSQARDTSAKKFIRNKPSESGHNDPRYNNKFHSRTFLTSTMMDTSPDGEKKEIKKILTSELITVLLNRRNVHKNMISDFEQNRCKRYLLNFLEKNPDCEEIHLGISQIYFSLGIYDKALQHITKALELNPKEAFYLSCRAIYLYTVKQWNQNVRICLFKYQI